MRPTIPFQRLLPVPDSAIVCGLPGPLVATIIVPVSIPARGGVKTTSMVQL
jgi:hypothetical protein